jgi:diguanylate cyclase (GGDEF)-like protein
VTGFADVGPPNENEPRDEASRPAVGPVVLRHDSVDAREALARDRDAIADGRDREAELRDDLADAADAQYDASADDRALDGRGPLDGHRIVFRAARDRQRAAADRVAAAAQRASAERDREYAARDRQLAAADREHAAAEHAAAGIDELTGCLRRGVGLTALEREVARAHRTQEPMVLAYIDVDALKLTNDSRGHAAGDRLLKRVADAIGSRLRPYDVTVRVGGDEFVCSLAAVGAESAWERFQQVAADLAADPEAGSISVGLAELQAGDSLDDVMVRADVSLLSQRGAPGSRSQRFRRPGRPRATYERDG